MKQTTIDYFATLDMPIYNIYGLSETTGPSTFHNCNKFTLKGAGYQLGGTELKIDNPDENGVGEITMRGRHIMMGYLKNEPATKEVVDL